MKKRIDVYLIGVLCLVLSVLFQVQDVKTMMEVVETDPTIEFDPNLYEPVETTTTDYDAIAYQAEQDRLAAEAAEAEEGNLNIDELDITDALEAEDGEEEHHHVEFDEYEQEEIEGGEAVEGEEAVDEETNFVGSTFELSLIAALDGVDGDLYTMLSAGLLENLDIDLVAPAVAAYKNKLKTLYNPLMTTRSQSNQLIIDKINQLEFAYSRKLVAVMSTAFTFLLGQTLSMDGSYQSSVTEMQSIFHDHKWTLGLSINDAPLSEDHLNHSFVLLDDVTSEETISLSSADFYDLILYSAVVVGGMVALSI